MRSIWIFASLVACAYAANSHNESAALKEKKVRYDNYKVYQIKVQDITQLSAIDSLRTNYEEYNILKEYDEITKQIHIMVAPTEDLNFQQFLKYYGLENKLLISNIQEEQFTHLLRSGKSKYDWSKYHNWSDIKKWMKGILKSFPKVTSAFIVGKSFEKRTIRGIKISYKSGNPGIFIESGIHAREWVAPATATWFINALLTSEDQTIRNLAENYDWYIVPVLNVDGYVYTHEKDRMWRKTRQPIKSSKCVGADANRNFDYNWMAGGNRPNKSSDPCSDTFAGTKPFSEPETAALANYLMSIKDKIQIYLALHSYGQLILSPYLFSKIEHPFNMDHLKAISSAFADAVYALPEKIRYVVSQASAFFYPTGGTSTDWVYSEMGIKICYTIEFRDVGIHGFALPPEQLLGNYNDFMAGVIALVHNAKQLKYV